MKQQKMKYKTKKCSNKLATEKKLRKRGRKWKNEGKTMEKNTQKRGITNTKYKQKEES